MNRKRYRERRAQCLAAQEEDARREAARIAKLGGGPADLVQALWPRAVTAAWAAKLLQEAQAAARD